MTMWPKSPVCIKLISRSNVLSGMCFLAVCFIIVICDQRSKMEYDVFYINYSCKRRIRVIGFFSVSCIKDFS